MKPSELYTSEMENLEKKLSGEIPNKTSQKYSDMPKQLVQAKIEFLIRKAEQLLNNRKHNN